MSRGKYWRGYYEVLKGLAWKSRWRKRKKNKKKMVDDAKIEGVCGARVAPL
jgi:hypothetical protein